jgi:hypothetical protein
LLPLGETEKTFFFSKASFATGRVSCDGRRKREREREREREGEREGGREKYRVEESKKDISREGGKAGEREKCNFQKRRKTSGKKLKTSKNEWEFLTKTRSASKYMMIKIDFDVIRSYIKFIC